MRDVRRLAELFIHYQLFFQRLASKICLTKNFLQLQAAVWRTMGPRSDPLKLALRFLLKTVAKTLRGFYHITDEDPKQQKVKTLDDFLVVLEYHWNNTFGYAQSVVIATRQQKLQWSAELPDEANVLKLRNYTEQQLSQSCTDDKFQFWSYSQFTIQHKTHVSGIAGWFANMWKNLVVMKDLEHIYMCVCILTFKLRIYFYDITAKFHK